MSFPVSLILAASLLGGADSRVKMNGWVVFDDEGKSLQSYYQHANLLQSISVEWIRCSGKAVVSRQSRPTTEEREKILTVAKKHGVKVYALIGNDGFLPESVEAALESTAAMSKHADALVKIAVEDRVDGLDLDYESLKAKDRDAFSQFVTILADKCHQKRLKLVMAVHAKESEPGTWDGAQAQDFKALGKAADFVRVMTYDLHWETSEAGPVASPDWVERVMSFAASVIPPKKLDLGIPSYGYDWVGKKADSFTWDGWQDRLKLHGPAKRDTQSHELTLSYGNRTAFYADGESSRPTFGIVRKLGLNGLAMWRLGSEDPAFWDLYRVLSK